MAKCTRDECLQGVLRWPSLSGCPQRSPGRKIAFFASNPQVFATPTTAALAVGEGRESLARDARERPAGIEGRCP